MTTINVTSLRKAMLAHQDMFARFVTIRANSEVDLWQHWGMDNGAFTGFDQGRFMSKLKTFLPYRSTCRFVVVPDIPFCWEPTLTKFADWSPSIRRLGFPVGLAVQDGATVANVPWSQIDALFIGGSTEWKRQTSIGDLPLFKSAFGSAVPSLIAEAKRRGLWVHIGRSANAPQQLRYAHAQGADSVDGTCERHAPHREFKWIAQTMWEIHQHKAPALDVAA